MLGFLQNHCQQQFALKLLLNKLQISTKKARSFSFLYSITLKRTRSCKCIGRLMGAIMCGFFRTLHDMFRRVHNMYPHTIIYFVSCTLDLCSPYVASEMTNRNLFQKNPKISKKSKNLPKSQNLPKKPKFAKKAKFG
jgi:hypothetical protein